MLNRIFFFLAFSLPLGAFAQTQFSILDIPVCWNDSSIIKYTYVTASGAYLDLGYYSPGGQPVTVSGGTLKTGFCATPAPTSDSLSIDSAGRSFTISLGDQDVSFNAGAEYLAQLLDVDTAGLDSNYIIKYSPSAGEWLVFDNNIDGLSDAAFSISEGNLMIGQKKQIPTLPGADNNSFLGVGFNLFDSLKYGYETMAFGIAAATQSDTLIRSIAMGKNSLTGALNRTVDNFQTAQAIYSVANGVFSSGLDTFVLNTVSIGSESNVIFQPRTLKRTENGVFIGARVRPKNPLSLYEIAIGSNVTGNGDSTVTLGQTFLKATYLNGTIDLNSYGSGNKTPSALSKTRSAYLAAYATDGTLIEVDTSAISPGGITQITAFNGLTDVGADSVKLGGVLTENTTVTGNNARSLEFTGLTTFGAGVVPATGSFQVGTPTNYVTGNDASGVEVYATKSWIKTPEFLLGNAVDTSLAFFNGALNLSMYGNGDNTGMLTYLAGFNSNGDLIEIDTAGFFPGGGGGGGGFDLPTDSITFNDNTGAAVAGKLQRDDNTGTLVYGSPTGTELRLQPPGWYVKNQTGSTIPRGTVVRAAGTVGNSGQILIDKMTADGSIEGKFLLGVTAEDIADGADGWVFSQGKIKPVDLSAYNSGEVLYVSTTVPGAFTDTLPNAPDLVLPLGFVVNNTSNGTLAVRVTFNPTVTATNGLTATAGADNTNIELGGTLTKNTTINANLKNLTINRPLTMSIDSIFLFRVRTQETISDPESYFSLGAATNRMYTTNPGDSITNRIDVFAANATDALSIISYKEGASSIYTEIELLPEKMAIITPGVNQNTASAGQYLKLIDANTGEVEFAASDAIVDTVKAGSGISVDGTVNVPEVRWGGNLTQNAIIGGQSLYSTTFQGLTSFSVTASNTTELKSDSSGTVTRLTTSPSQLQIVTPGVDASTVSAGAVLSLIDSTTGEVEFLPLNTLESDTAQVIDFEDLPQKIYQWHFTGKSAATASFTNVKTGAIYVIHVLNSTSGDVITWPANTKTETGATLTSTTLSGTGRIFTLYSDGTNTYIK